MKLALTAVTVVACATLVTACAVLGKPFVPKTPDEQAIARTMETFLAAFRARDYDTVRTVVEADATVATVSSTDRTAPERLLALRQRAERSPLLQVAPDKLINFWQISPDHAALGTYIHNYLESDVETTHITWELHRREGQWRIQSITQTIWLTPYYTRGSGP